MADLEILGIPGSLRQASFNRFALVAAQSLLPPGVSLDIFGLDGSPPTTRISTSSRRPGWWS
jgi:NAD(P)H-dependent FMN reductase